MAANPALPLRIIRDKMSAEGGVLMRKGLSSEEKEARWAAISEGMTNRPERKLTSAEQQQSWTEAAKRNAERKANAAKRKDPEKYKQQVNAWQRENTQIIQLRLTKSSGLIEAINNAANDRGIPVTTYVRKAVISQLQRDGYISYEKP